MEKEKIEYPYHILDGNNTEPSISENHKRMQIVISFAYCMIWIRLEILG